MCIYLTSKPTRGFSKIMHRRQESNPTPKQLFIHTKRSFEATPIRRWNRVTPKFLRDRANREQVPRERVPTLRSKPIRLRPHPPHERRKVHNLLLLYWITPQLRLTPSVMMFRFWLAFLDTIPLQVMTLPLM